MIEKNQIATLAELGDKYLLMCANAFVFNQEHQPVYKEASELKVVCLETIKVCSFKLRLIVNFFHLEYRKFK
jgi:hypothetical protein